MIKNDELMNRIAEVASDAIDEIELIENETRSAYFAGWTAACLGEFDDVRRACNSYMARLKIKRGI